ncbi:MAG: hypothetical protein M3340_11395 [Actinomycetota bacterium]|nr:hypothetical protein [Actinomycetota bacterium]
MLIHDRQVERDAPRPSDGDSRHGPVVALTRTLLRVNLVLASVVLVGAGVGLIYSFESEPGETPLRFALREVGAGLTVAGVVTICLYLLIQRNEDRFKDRLSGFIEEDVAEDLEEIKREIAGQAQRLFDASSSLEALHASGVERVYEDRGLAGRELERALERSSITRLRLMGISLNDFVRSDQAEGLHGVWEIIGKYVRGERPLPGDSDGLDIQILIVDSNCFGAQLRAHAETKEKGRTSLAGRLDSDVTQTALHLKELVRLAEENRERTNVTFDFRLYRLAPTLFVCHAEGSGEEDGFSYVQPYYFWSRRDSGSALPLVRLQRGSALAAGVKDHFDVIWSEASTPGLEWVEGCEVGPEKGAYETGVVNVFTDKDQARHRMERVLERAERCVYIQGVSLKSFFSAGPASLLGALGRVLETRPEVEVKVLALDPDCGQARQRSYRELALSLRPGATLPPFDEYAADPELHVRSLLHQDTSNTIEQMRSLDHPSFHARLYDSTPPCFMLLVDDVVFVEQFHLGKLVEGGQGLVTSLGKDMPLVEYRRPPLEMFKQAGMRLRSPVGLLEDHFEFVFEHLARPA